MSRLMSKGAERHANFLAGTPNWVDPMSRSMCMSRPYESISVAVYAKITEQSFSILFHRGRPYESTHEHESTLWVDPCDEKISQWLVFNPFQLYLMLI